MGLTRTLAAYAASTRWGDLGADVRHESARAFLNWVGVAIGGCDEEAVRLAAALARDAGGQSQSTVIGQRFKTDAASAAFVNCIASSVQAFDDAHLPSVAHPSGPAASALFALAESRRLSGEDFLSALALGIEIQCRIANMLVLPPSTFHPSFYTNGFSGPIGVALAAGRLIGLDEQKLAWAIGIAASQASGFRSTHGTMTAHFRPGHATRAGLQAALLAEKGFDCSEDSLEARGGFLDVYANGAEIDIVTNDLGSRHEMLANRYKPYPCGIVIHPVIDACLDIRARLPAGLLPEKVSLRVNPAVLTLTGKRAPKTPLESHVSVYHWAACAFVLGRADIAQTHMDCLIDPAVVAFREEVAASAEQSVGKGEAFAEATLPDGSIVSAHVTTPRGSLERPLTDAELDAKFDALVASRMTADASARLRQACRTLAAVPDVGVSIGPLLP